MTSPLTFCCRFLTFVPAIQEFCLFASIGLLVDFYLQMVFFATVLSIDIRRLELSDLDRNHTYLHVTVRTSIILTFMWRCIPLLYLPSCDGTYLYNTYLHVTVRTSIILTFMCRYVPLLLYLPLCDSTYLFYTYFHGTVRTYIILSFMGSTYLFLYMYLLLLIFIYFLQM